MAYTPAENYKLFKCDCYTEGLIVEEDFEPEVPSMHTFYLCFWHYGQGSNSIGWWNRIRAVWKILTTGLPYADMVVLHKTEAKQFAEYLLERIKSREEGK